MGSEVVGFVRLTLCIVMLTLLLIGVGWTPLGQGIWSVFIQPLLVVVVVVVKKYN